MSVVTSPKEWRRETRMTYTVTGADPMTMMNGGQGVPFEVELVWLDGTVRPGLGTIRGHRLKNDGTVGRAVASALIPRVDQRPDWLATLMTTAVEPTGVDTPIERLQRKHRTVTAGYAEWRALGMSTFRVWEHHANNMPYGLLYELIPSSMHDRLHQVIDDLNARNHRVWDEIKAEFKAACDACWPGTDRPSPPISPDEFDRFRRRTAGSRYAELLMDLLHDRDIRSKVWHLIRPDENAG